MKDFNFPPEFTMANSGKRIKWVEVPKDKYPSKVYVILYKPMEAKPMTDTPDVIYPTPVAVYVRDGVWATLHKDDLYVYAGDKNVE